jgi:hypothetical protein
MKRDKECEECNERVHYLRPWQIDGSDLFQVCRRCWESLKLMYPGMKPHEF